MTGRASESRSRPVVVPAGAEVLLELRAGAIAHTGVFHLPVVAAAAEGRVFEDGPAKTLCGLTGETFALGGELLDLRLCSVCETRAPRSMRAKPPARERKPRGKPRWKHSRIKPAHLEVLYRLYVHEKLSCRKIAELVYERLGYKSARSCGESLYLAFHAAGYQLRSRSEATAMRNYKHGRRSRATVGTPEEHEYRRWPKRELGRYRPLCAGVKLQSPGKGKRCSRPAMDGSGYCFQHDPAARVEVERIAATMRERQPRYQYVPWADVAAQLAPLLAGERYPKMALSRATGVPHAAVSRLLNDPPERITVQLAGRLLAPLELRRAA